MSGRRILIVKLAALGDIAVSTTVVSRIRAEHPEARVTWLTGERGRPLVELFGVDEVIALDEQRLLRGSLPARLSELGRTWARLAGRHFDQVLTLHADPQYRILTWTVRARRRLALSLGGPNPNPVLWRYRGDEYARLLSGDDRTGPVARRFPLADVRPMLPARAAGRSGVRVALVPGGARNVLREDSLRRWPVASYAAVASELSGAGIEVMLCGDAADAWVRPAFDGIPVRDEIGKHDLSSTLALLRDSDVVVTHDTGPLHLARLVRTPIVALFGPTDPGHVIGEDPDITTLWGGARLACRPCYDGRNYAPCASNLCLQTVSVEHVVAAVRGRLGARASDGDRGIRIVG